MNEAPNQQRKNILWLASWYPNRDDQYTGDFIQRHAQAAALENNIHVLYVTATNSAKLKFENVQKGHNGLTEQIIYLKTANGIYNKLIKHYYWFKQFQKAIKNYIDTKGLPHAVHVHVSWKAGLIALWLKKKYGLHYYITEHWGIYNRIVKDNFFEKNFIVRYLIKKIFKESVQLISVSHFLAQNVKSWLSNPKVTIIPNVVNTRLFFPQRQKHNKFTFIHVSSIVPLKNVKGILNAFKLCSISPLFESIQLMIVGTKDNSYQDYVKKLGIERNVILKPEILYTEVAKEMRLAHCLILNSIMENSPCVIGEAHCSGLPVIATNVGGIPELVNETNGILLPPNNDEALAKAILHVFENYHHYNTISIAKTGAKKFAYNSVAKQLDLVYNKL